AALRKSGLRAEVDLRNEKINYKVREHSLAKVPVMLVVGKREAEEKSVSVRRMGVQQQQVIPLAEAVKLLADEAVPPDLKEASGGVRPAACRSRVPADAPGRADRATGSQPVCALPEKFPK